MAATRFKAAIGGVVVLLCAVLALTLDVTERPSEKDVAEVLDGPNAVSFAVAGGALAWARPRRWPRSPDLSTDPKNGLAQSTARGHHPVWMPT